MSPVADHDPRGVGAGFAAALRTRRLARGLTQEELAARAGLGVRTLRELERGRVARPQRGTLTLLADALDLVGTDREDFVAGTVSSAPTTLPLPTAPALIGRSSDVAELLDLLERTDLIVLVGLAGVGKTGLAHAVAHAFAGTAVSVTITDVSQPTDVFAAVAAVFGVARAEELLDRPSLLVLDGIDRSHRSAVKAITWLRARVPAVKILATSRRPLAGVVPGAVDWRVDQRVMASGQVAAGEGGGLPVLVRGIGRARLDIGPLGSIGCARGTCLARALPCPARSASLARLRPRRGPAPVSIRPPRPKQPRHRLRSGDPAMARLGLDGLRSDRPGGVDSEGAVASPGSGAPDEAGSRCPGLPRLGSARGLALRVLDRQRGQRGPPRGSSGPRGR